LCVSSNLHTAGASSMSSGLKTRMNTLKDANTCGAHLRSDADALVTTLAHLLACNGGDATTLFLNEAVACLTDIEKTAGRAKHLLYIYQLESKLRDASHLVDSRGVIYVFRGLQEDSLILANISGQFRHLLKPTWCCGDEFSGIMDDGPVEKFTIRQGLPEPSW
jgi:hypothetical protein